jgi:UDPglucose--hexose-1-phosphate uridylyltransferase
LTVAERGDVALVVPWAGRVPFELLVAPRSHAGGAFGDRNLAVALQLLADGVRRLRAAEGHVAWNAWLHDSGHWHLEVLPRLTVFGGLELGAGVYVNPLPPERAAALLREPPAG